MSCFDIFDRCNPFKQTRKNQIKKVEQILSIFDCDPQIIIYDYSTDSGYEADSENESDLEVYVIPCTYAM